MAQTKRQLLEQQLAQSQEILQQAQNPNLFGAGRAGAFGAIAQGITAGIGAYSQYKAQQKILANEAQNVSKFKDFAISKGNQALADVAESLSPETREAYIMQSVSPKFTGSLNTPASVQEFEYYQNLSPQLQRQFQGLRRNVAGEGGIINASGNIETLQGYGQAGAQRKGLEQSAKNISDLAYQPEIAGQKTYAQEKAQEDVKAQESVNKVTSQIDNISQTLTAFEKHPGFSDIVGAKGGGAILYYAGKETPIQGTQASGAQALLDQIKGQQFLSAFESLKGGGQISEKEGQQATNALSAIKSSTSEADIKKNIETLRKVLNIARERSITRAGQGYQRASTANKAPMDNTAGQKSTIIRRYNPQTGRIE